MSDTTIERLRFELFTAALVASEIEGGIATLHAMHEVIDGDGLGAGLERLRDEVRALRERCIAHCGIEP